MRYSSLLAASGLLASGLAIAAPAQATAPGEAEATKAAAPVCKLIMPSRFYINANSRTYTIHITESCDKDLHKQYVQWRGTAPNEPDWEKLTYSGSATSVGLTFFDSVDPIGRTYWKKYEAYNTDGDPIATNDAVSYFKYASWAAVSASRNGSKVTVNARASRYWAGGNKYIPYAKKYAVLQWKTPGTSTWHNLKNVTLNNAGKASYTYTVSASRDYRVYVTATPYIWEYASAAYRR